MKHETLNSNFLQLLMLTIYPLYAFAVLYESKHSRQSFILIMGYICSVWLTFLYWAYTWFDVFFLAPIICSLWMFLIFELNFVLCSTKTTLVNIFFNIFKSPIFFSSTIAIFHITHNLHPDMAYGVEGVFTCFGQWLTQQTIILVSLFSFVFFFFNEIQGLSSVKHSEIVFSFCYLFIMVTFFSATWLYCKA